MLTWSYEIENTSIGKIERIHETPGCFYRLTDESRLRLQVWPASCFRCGRFTEAERIETLEELDAKLAQLRDPERRGLILPQLRFADPLLIEQLIGQCELRRAWRQTRVSPAKCIECGSTEICLLSGNEPISHPCGVGELVVRISLSGGISIRYEILVTPEGDRLPLEPS
ncbi:MAG TPA: hypothetical protein VK797_25360 [Tepidisphaeraceae bacterium]|jgi:hypothetical protein|nr:hypothetical protein [Tepidisphaeraceae bacterium]